MTAEDQVRAILDAHQVWGMDLAPLVKELADLVRKGPVPPITITITMSVAGVSLVSETPAPEGLCGFYGCVFTPHDDDSHSWEVNQKGTA